MGSSFSKVDVIEDIVDGLRRRKRAISDQELAIIQTQISILARAITSISLVNGLTDGSIPGDQVIAELMNVEKLEELTKLDKKTVDGFVEKLKAISGKLSSKTADLETHLVNLNKMKMMWSEVGDLKNLPKQAFFDSVKTLGTIDLGAFGSFDSKNVDPVKKACESVMKILEGKGVLKGLEDMEPFHRIVPITEININFNPLSIRTFQKPTVTELGAEMKELESLTRESFIDVLSSVLSSKSAPIRQFTSGYFYGFQDLKALEEDVKNEWLLKVTNTPVSNITILSALYSPMTDLNQKWSSISSPSIKKTLSKLAAMQNHFGTFEGASSELSDIVDSFQALKLVGSNAMLGAVLKSLSGSLRKLEKKAKSIQEISGMLLNSPGQEITKKLESLVKTVNSSPTIKELVDELFKDDNFEFIAKFDSKYDIKNYMEFFSGLETLKKNPKKVSIVAELAQELRDATSDHFFHEELRLVVFFLVYSPPSASSLTFPEDTY